MPPVEKSLIRVPPFWCIGAPDMLCDADGVSLFIEPGPGFGNGAHETTQLCLRALAAATVHDGAPVLDFGAGSAILAIAAAKLGARVDAVEIDERALEHAARNLHANAAAERVALHRTLDDLPGPYALVIANILCSVLVRYAAELVSRLAPDGMLVLSGLVSTDVPEIVGRFSGLLGGRRPSVHQHGEWRAVVFWPGAPPSG